MKPCIPQTLVACGGLPIEDYEWYDSNLVVLLTKRSIVIKEVSKASDRPYSNIVTTGLDFSPLDDFVFVNDKLIPNACQTGEYRDPDYFLRSLEEQADARKIFKDNADPSSSPQSNK